MLLIAVVLFSLVSLVVALPSSLPFKQKWQACPPTMGSTQMTASDTANLITIAAECAIFSAPLLYDNDTARTFDVFVKRVFRQSDHPSSSSLSQLWMLSGGPDNSEWANEPSAFDFLSHLPNTIVYLPDQRGTGKSSPLICDPIHIQTNKSFPVADSDWTPCVQWLQQTAPYTTPTDSSLYMQAISPQSSARDVGIIASMMASKHHYAASFLYGISYGTHWGLQILIDFPSLFERIALDGVLPPSIGWISYQSQYYDDATRALLSACDKDPFCSTLFKPSAFDVAMKAFSKIDDGHCHYYIPGKGKLTSVMLKTIIGQMIPSAEHREFILPLLDRFARCSIGDLLAITTTLPTLAKMFSTAMTPQQLSAFVQSPFCDVQQNHMVSVSLWGDFTQQMFDDQKATNASVAILDAIQLRLNVKTMWPQQFYYPQRNVLPTNIDPSTTLLILNGQLDPQTPMGLAHKLFNTIEMSPSQKFLVEVPWAAHGTIEMTSNPTKGLYSCGFQIAASYFKGEFDPKVTPDCFNDIVPFDFRAKRFADATLLKNAYGDIPKQAAQIANQALIEDATS